MRREFTSAAFTIALLLMTALAPARADISRSVSVSICNNAVHGRCKATKDRDDPFDRVLFKCQVFSPDHVPTLMGSANMDAELLPDVPMSATMRDPKPGPVHAWHQYCRKMTGVFPYSRIRFFPTPLFYSASLPDATRCMIVHGEGAIR